MERFRLQHSELPIHLTPEDCRGKTYIVTGSNTGIGYECAKHLVNLEASRVILGVRSMDRGNAAKAQIEADTGRKGVVEVWFLDLSSYTTVSAFAKKVEGELTRLDGVVCNAVNSTGSWVMSEGLESSLTANVVSTFLLVVLMMPFLKRCAGKFGTKPRVTFIASAMGFDRKRDLDRIGEGNVLKELSDGNKWAIDGANRYSLTKLLEIILARHLASLAPASETGVVINYVCPGLCNTTLAKEGQLMVRIMIFILRGIMGRSAEWGSRNLLYGITAGEESHGKFITYAEVRESWVPDFITNSYGKKWEKRIWDDVAAEMNKVEPGCVDRALKA